MLRAPRGYSEGMRRVCADTRPKRAQEHPAAHSTTCKTQGNNTESTKRIRKTNGNKGNRQKTNEKRLKKRYAPRCAPCIYIYIYIYASGARYFQLCAEVCAVYIYIHIYIYMRFRHVLRFSTLSVVCRAVARSNSGQYVGALVGISS